jgi:hypothetical protein
MGTVVWKTNHSTFESLEANDGKVFFPQFVKEIAWTRFVAAEPILMQGVRHVSA